MCFNCTDIDRFADYEATIENIEENERIKENERFYGIYGRQKNDCRNFERVAGFFVPVAR